MNNTNYLTSLVKDKDRRERSGLPKIFVGKISSETISHDHGNRFLTNTGYDVEVLDTVNADGTSFIIGGCYLVSGNAGPNGFGDRNPLTKNTPVVCMSLRGDYKNVFILGSFKAYGYLAKYFQQGISAKPNQAVQNKWTNTAGYSIYPPLVALPNSQTDLQPRYNPEYQTKTDTNELGVLGPELGGLDLFNRFNGDKLTYTVGKQIYYADEDLILLSGVAGKNKCDSFKEISLFFTNYAETLEKTFTGVKDTELEVDSETELEEDPLFPKEEEEKKEKEENSTPPVEAKAGSFGGGSSGGGGAGAETPTPADAAADASTATTESQGSSTYQTSRRNNDSASEVSMEIGKDSDTFIKRFNSLDVDFREWSTLTYHIKQLKLLAKNYSELSITCEQSNNSALLLGAINEKEEEDCKADKAEEAPEDSLVTKTDTFIAIEFKFEVSSLISEDLDNLIKEIPQKKLFDNKLHPTIHFIKGVLADKDVSSFTNELALSFKERNSTDKDLSTLTSFIKSNQEESTKGQSVFITSVYSKGSLSLDTINANKELFNKHNFDLVCPENGFGGIALLKYNKLNSDTNNITCEQPPKQTDLDVAEDSLRKRNTLPIAQIPAADQNFKKGRQKTISRVVLHNTYVTIEETVAIFKALEGYNKNKVSAHYTVDRQGNIYQHVKEEDTAFHAAGENNWDTLGIEIVAYESQPFMTKVQESAVISLVQETIDKYNISKENILPHRELYLQTECPNRIWLFDDTPAKLKTNHPYGSFRQWINKNF